MARVHAPKHLSPKTGAWYRYVMQSWHMDQHDERMLVLACEAFDRALAAREKIDELGITFEDRFGTPRPRPEIKIELDNRRQFCQIIRQLNLNEDATPDNFL